MDFLEWTGATRDLETLAQELGEVATGRFMAKLVDEISKEAVRLIKKEFETSTDPYGKKWKPLVKKKETRIGGPLLKTGAMMKSIRRQLTRDGFKLVSDSAYIRFHQKGSRSPRPGKKNSRRDDRGRFIKRAMHIPPRIIFPLESGDAVGNPDDGFTRMIQQAIENSLRKLDIDIFNNENTYDIADFSGGGFSFRKGT